MILVMYELSGDRISQIKQYQCTVCGFVLETNNSCSRSHDFTVQYVWIYQMLLPWKQALHFMENYTLVLIR